MAETDAERHMIEMLRQHRHLTLTISRDSDQWHIRLQHHDSGLVGEGEGATFDQAWEGMVDNRLRSRK